MPQKLTIQGTTQAEDIVLYALNNKPLAMLYGALASFAYHQLIYNLLILAQSYSNVANEELEGYLEHLEENILYMAKGCVQFIAKKHTQVLAVAEAIGELYLTSEHLFTDEWQQKITSGNDEWGKIQPKSKAILSQLGIDLTMTLDAYEDYLDDSFLF